MRLVIKALNGSMKLSDNKEILVNSLVDLFSVEEINHVYELTIDEEVVKEFNVLIDFCMNQENFSKKRTIPLKG